MQSTGDQVDFADLGMLDVPQMDLRYNLQFIICNVGYSPEFNAIEAVFSKVKALYNRQ